MVWQNSDPMTFPPSADVDADAQGAVDARRALHRFRASQRAPRSFSVYTR